MLNLYSLLDNRLGMSRNKLDYFAVNAPKKYKVYSIPKRTSGHRIIAHPAKPLKKIQAALVSILREELPVHSAAFAYKKGLGIRDNAMVHQKSNYLLKMDFSDFFNSITPELFFKICKTQKIQWSTAEKRLLTQLLFWNRTKSYDGKLILSIGAPSSPLISNFVMYNFDQQLAAICQSQQINYSRYADDLTFSTKNKDLLFDLPNQVKLLLKYYYDNFITVNEMKTMFSSKRHNRHVTGVTLTNNNKLSLGREKKRMISSLIHQYKVDILDEDDSYYLQGMLAFAMSIEPEFIERMKKKYSPQLVTNILSLRAE